MYVYQKQLTIDYILDHEIIFALKIFDTILVLININKVKIKIDK